MDCLTSSNALREVKCDISAFEVSKEVFNIVDIGYFFCYKLLLDEMTKVIRKIKLNRFKF